MNKQEFDAALMSALEDSGSFDDGVDFEKRLAQVGLRIVPAEPVAWRVKDRHGLPLWPTSEAHADFYARFGEKINLYAGPTES